MNKPLCITFAGPVGSGKTPIAYFLSWNLGLPILNNDSMRTETQEDMGELDMQIYKQKRDSRVKSILENKISFIYDASVDREWKNKKDIIYQHDYRVFIISMDFSLYKIKKIFQSKDYNQFDHLEKTYLDHQNFLAEYSEIVNLSLTDNDFENRLELSLSSLRRWLDNKNPNSN